MLELPKSEIASFPASESERRIRSLELAPAGVNLHPDRFFKGVSAA